MKLSLNGSWTSAIFRKKILGMGDGGLLIDLNEVEQDVAHRAARLYRFDEKKYQALERRGFDFEV